MRRRFARGSAGYAQAFAALPEALIAGVVVLVFTAVACLGVKDSVGVAAVMTVIELVGLVVVLGAGWAPVRDLQGAALALVQTLISDSEANEYARQFQRALTEADRSPNT